LRSATECLRRFAGTGPARDFRELFAVDEAARERTEELVGGLKKG